MKKTILFTLFLCFTMTAAAQPQGFQMPRNNATFQDLNYAGDDLEAHRLDIYLPDTGKDKYPVVVAIYGSAWYSNNMKAMTFMSIGKPLVDAGFAVVCINHRSSGDAKFPAQIHDVKAALRFVRANADKYKLDTSFVGITGFSSGGHLASLAGVTNKMKTRTVGSTTVDLEGTVGGNLDFPSTVDAVVDWFGPVDMAHMENCETVKDGRSPEAALIGGAPADNPDLVALISPITYVTPQCPRFLVFHGEADNVVPHCQGARFSEVLKQAGRLDAFVSVPDGQHGPVTFNEQTFKQMTDFFIKEALAAHCPSAPSLDPSAPSLDPTSPSLNPSAPSNASTQPTGPVSDGLSVGSPHSRLVEDGGTGPYKAIMTEVKGFEAHTIFAPQDLSVFNAKHPLPVLVWGNGACNNSPFEHYKFLNEIASYGFLVVATGYIPMDDKPYRGPMSTTQQQIESIDWAFAQNADPQSPYYQKIDVRHIAAAGMSCGGLQTLFNCADPRITTLMICNSGLFNRQNAHQAVGGMPMPPKEKLAEIHTPVLYILGGKPDIAYENGMDDFRRINHVPACAANLPVGHGGTYAQPHGGEFAVVALAWLQWQLKGDKQAAKMFRGRNNLLQQREGWTLEKNKKMK